MNKYILPSDNEQYNSEFNHIKLKKSSFISICSPYSGLLKLKINFKVLDMESLCKVKIVEYMGFAYGEIHEIQDNIEYIDKEIEYVAKVKSGMPIHIETYSEDGYLDTIKVCYDKISIVEEME